MTFKEAAYDCRDWQLEKHWGDMVGGAECSPGATEWTGFAEALESDLGAVLASGTGISYSPWRNWDELGSKTAQLFVAFHEAMQGTSRQKPFVETFKRLVSEVETLTEIYYLEQDGCHTFWTVVESFDDPSRKEIYPHQTKLYQKFPSRKFKFNMVARDLSDPSSEIPPSAELVFDKSTSVAA